MGTMGQNITNSLSMVTMIGNIDITNSHSMVTMLTNITNIPSTDSKQLQLYLTSPSLHGQLPGTNHSRDGRMDRLLLEEEEELRE